MGKKKKQETGSDKVKQDNTAKLKDSEQIPSELPSLTQDVLNEAIPDQDAQSDEDIPDELPSLDLDNAPSEKKPEDSFEKLQIEAEELEKEAKVETKIEPKPIEQEKLEEPPRPVEGSSYFSEIAENIKDNKPAGNLLDGMKHHWENKKFEEQGLKTATQQEIEMSIREKIRGLQELEARWVEQKRTLEHTRNMTMSIEAEISIKSEELKNILSKLEKVESIYEKIKQQPSN